MSAHTPGPWRLSSDTGFWSATYDDTGTSAYTAIRSRDETVVALAVAQDSRLFTSADTRGNARLIAAAPELLAALKELLAAGDGTVTAEDGIAAMLRFGEAHEVAREVVAKAEAA